MDDQGASTGQNPFRASYPHLLDIGIMGHCVHGSSGLCLKAGVECYQDGLHIDEPNMTLEDYESIMKQSQGKLFQVALGGRGDPDQHEFIEQILKMTRRYGIVPNLTTSGLGLTDKLVAMLKTHCGAVAVSWYRSDYTLRAIDMLLRAGITTNIHYVLSKDSIDEAIDRMTNKGFPEGVNRTVFLLHKPVGQGTMENVLKDDDPRTEQFFHLFNEDANCQKAGFDSCSIPALIRWAPNIRLESVDTCEGGRFSAYIASDMTMLPCSFDRRSRWSVDLNEVTIEEAWNSRAFDDFRQRLSTSCMDCSQRHDCYGGCPIEKDIVLCSRKERIYENQI